MSSAPVPIVTETSPPMSAVLEPLPPAAVPDSLPPAAISDSLSPAATADRWVYGLVALVLALMGLGIESDRTAAGSGAGSGVVLDASGAASTGTAGTGTAGGRLVRAVLAADMPVRSGAVLPLDGSDPVAALLPATTGMRPASGGRHHSFAAPLPARPIRTGAHPPTGPPLLSRI
ncbi:hypothetical protein [Oleisolibacter albus]|uniref:hypothetical protein n=1 Tax=Oleisolibacter albus TaxID=2171757 RepID=UPI0012D761C9|nr:hypothetical protein [Oleisolibacter albus]